MAAPEHPFLQRLEAMLPATHPLVWGQTVLEEVQGAAGLENPPHLGKGGGHVRNRAQRPRGQRGIEAVVLERQRLAIQAGPLHRDARLSHTFLGQPPAHVGRLDGGNPGNGRRVEGDVVARAKAQLDDASFEPLADATSQRRDTLQPARDVDYSRKNLLAIESHQRPIFASITLVLADDHTILRSGLRMLLEAEADFEVVAEAGEVLSALQAVRGHRPDVLVLDLNMPGGSSIEAIRRLALMSPSTSVVVLTMEEDRAFVRDAMEAGARGYVLKREASERLVSAIRAAAPR